MSANIQGLGIATAPQAMTQEEATKLASEVICRSDQQERMLAALYRKAGVDQRYTVLPHTLALRWLPESPDGTRESRPSILGPSTAERMRFFSQHAPPLATRAASAALRDARVEAGEITHLVTVTCTGFESPGFDHALFGELNLAPTTQRLQIGFMGCHGAINGLRAAQALALADPEARILLCAVELCSLHYTFHWDPQRLVANALFADGAAAAVIGGAASARPSGPWKLAATGSFLIPNSKEAMGWRIGDHGFEMTLDAAVPGLITQHLRPGLSEWLAKQGLKQEDVQSWAVHPGGPRILGAIEESLALPRDATAASREILAQYGNMSSPTVLFILHRLRELQAPRPCVALGFGPGLFAEAALFTG